MTLELCVGAVDGKRRVPGMMASRRATDAVYRLSLNGLISRVCDWRQLFVHTLYLL